MRGLIRRERIDVIHSHRYKENILGWLSARGTGGVELVSTQHGMPEALSGRRQVKNFLLSTLNELILSRYFDVLVAVSHEMRDKLVTCLEFPEERITVIKNGIETGACLQRQSDNPDVVIGSAGRPLPVKDYPLMVKIAKKLSSAISEVRFELAGEGPERTTLEHLIDALEIGKIFRLKGEISDMDCFYRGIHVYLNTSRHEGLPMSILEAMASGLPVAAPSVGGFL
jgi:glycosyltransferase involved in cell wall biosynthesis